MSETIQNLVNAIRNGDALATEQGFSAAMAEKLSDRLETMRQDIAQSMFTQQPVEEEYELSEQEIAAVSAIDETDLNMLTDEELESIQEAQQWIAGAIKHPGAETKSAKRAGMTTHEYAEKHKHDKGTAGKRARLALTLSKISKKK